LTPKSVNSNEQNLYAVQKLLLALTFDNDIETEKHVCVSDNVEL